jgi:hypothetical protein
VHQQGEQRDGTFSSRYAPSKIPRGRETRLLRPSKPSDFIQHRFRFDRWTTHNHHRLLERQHPQDPYEPGDRDQGRNSLNTSKGNRDGPQVTHQNRSRKRFGQPHLHPRTGERVRRVWKCCLLAQREQLPPLVRKPATGWYGLSCVYDKRECEILQSYMEPLTCPHTA